MPTGTSWRSRVKTIVNGGYCFLTGRRGDLGEGDVEEGRGAGRVGGQSGVGVG